VLLDSRVQQPLIVGLGRSTRSFDCCGISNDLNNTQQKEQRVIAQIGLL
jgi:hypothetical protein